MVMFSGPNYIIPIPVLKFTTHFKGTLLSHSVLQSLAATRRPSKDPNHLALYHPIQHSPPARQTRSKAIAQAVLTPSPRAPLDGTPAVPQLSAQSDRGPIIEAAAPSIQEGRGPRRSNSFSGVVGGFPGTSRTIFRGPGEDGKEEEENPVGEEGSDGTEGFHAPVGVSQGTGGPTLAQSNQSEPSLLAIMQKKT
ncbi:hypothetical protein O181_028863 [Austropuccinia psidii MF-1]|uniref:Uncharacterized protein n=1 Tax=Austropuccinia psidii MF-1 TaxID=1389203 RepID=A0A9Q3CUP3_9BASI|nr:hypothetical protein [Austropuccinia psidii MF-1]